MPCIQRVGFTCYGVFAPQTLRIHRTHRPLEGREWQTGSAARTDACTCVWWQVIALPGLRNVRKFNFRQPDILQATCLLLKQQITGSHWPNHVRASALLDVDPIPGRSAPCKKEWQARRNCIAKTPVKLISGEPSSTDLDMATVPLIVGQSLRTTRRSAE